MPRRSRIDAPGALHHIIFRGIERRKIFRDDADRDRFLNRFGNVLKDTLTPCYGWALMPNHAHLLLKTGHTPIATVMRRLLTGYAIDFNHRYKRHGQLFQNRYKSILCQEDSYLCELVRYIHLNPLRAGLVADLKALDRYPYSGHGAILGKVKNSWQAVDEMLSFFCAKRANARKKYRSFVEKGIAAGKRPELSGGGLLRSIGGWSVIKDLRRQGERLKGDERILGDSDFVNSVLKQADEKLDRRNYYEAQGYDLQTVAERVAQALDITVKEVWAKGRKPAIVKARSLLCFWAVRELGYPATELAQALHLTQPAVSIAVRRGEKIAKENQYQLTDR